MDKKMLYKGNELKVKDIYDEISDVLFPTRLREDCTFLEATDRTGKIICLLCMDNLPGSAMALHIYIPEDNRNKTNILMMREMFYALIHPWVKRRGNESIIVNCASDDAKTMKLFETFGFVVETSAFGIMPVKEV